MATQFNMGVPPSQMDPTAGMGLAATADPTLNADNIDPNSPDSPYSGVSPEIRKINEANAALHEQKHEPLLSSFKVFANPQSPPESKLKAAEVLKNFAGTDDARPMDALQAVLGLDFRGAYIALTGGSNVIKAAQDQDGNDYQKVFNQRGEFRGYQTTDGRRLSPEELKGKYITSFEELPVTQRIGFIQQAINAKTAAAANSQNWVENQRTAATAGTNAEGILDASTQLSDLLPKLAPYSVNPETRSLIAGIGSMQFGNREAIEQIRSQLQNVESLTKEQKQELARRSLEFGIKIGNYAEGKNIEDIKSSDWKQADEQAAKKATEKSTFEQIQASKKDLLQKAQILAAKGQIKNLDDITQAINLEAQIQGNIANIQSENGGKGLGFAQPNVGVNTGDSFSSWAVKNAANKHYGNLARIYADNVFNIQKNLPPNSAPAIGDAERFVLQDPRLKQSQLERKTTIEGLQNYFATANSNISQGGVPPQLTTAQPASQLPSIIPPQNTAPMLPPAPTNPNKPVTYGQTAFGNAGKPEGDQADTPAKIRDLLRSGVMSQESARIILKDMKSRGIAIK